MLTRQILRFEFSSGFIDLDLHVTLPHCHLLPALLLLLPICAGASPADEPSSHANSPRNGVPCIGFLEPTEWIPLPCPDPPPPSLGTGEGIEDVPPQLPVQSTDAHFSPAEWRGPPLTRWWCDCRGDDAVDWANKTVAFDKDRIYTPQEQETVIEAERRLLNATRATVPDGPSHDIQQLGVTVTPGPEAATPEDWAGFGEPSTEPQGNAGVAPAGARNHWDIISRDSQGNRRFGASYSSDISIHANPRNGELFTKRTVEFDTSIFHRPRQIARFVLNSVMNCNSPSNTAQASMDLLVLGQQRRRDAWGLGRFPLDYPPGNNGRQRVHDSFRDYFRASARFMVGPIPMSVRVAVRGRVTLDMAGNLDCGGMSLDAEPAAHLFVNTSASVNLRIIRFGVQGELSLITAALPASTAIAWEPTSLCANWHAQVSRQYRTLDGNITLFTIVRFLFFQQRYDLNIASWRGIVLDESPRTEEGSFCALAAK
jgi:hypothetical protein